MLFLDRTVHIFPPIGMAAVLTKCQSISDDVFLETAESLAAKTPEARLASGMLFPAFSDMTVRTFAVVLGQRVFLIF